MLRGRPAVAIVGTRRPSPVRHARSPTRSAAGWARPGVTVVSGLALGIDATAHRGCLDGSGTAVAVLACGPERAYPRRHRRLHEQVAERGVVLSELPPGTPAQRWSFPARNRIMAGLARLTARGRGGGPERKPDHRRLRPRRWAARWPPCPGRVTARMAAGTNGLLRDGAVPGHVDRGRAGRALRRRPAARSGRPARARRRPSDAALRDVLDAVEAGAGVDEIVRRTGSSAAEVRAALGRLEAEGHVVRGVLGGWERAAM